MECNLQLPLKKANNFFFLEHTTEMTWTNILLTTILNEQDPTGKLTLIMRMKQAYSLTGSRMKAVKISISSLQVEVER
jgi:hypothetical protein